MLYHPNSQFFRLFLSSSKAFKGATTSGSTQKVEAKRDQTHSSSVGV
jgi:hypothetical protein